MFRGSLIVALIFMQLAAGDSGAVCSCDQTGFSVCWLDSNSGRSSTESICTSGCQSQTAGLIESSIGDDDCPSDATLASVVDSNDSGDVRSDSSSGRRHRKMPRHLAISRARGAAFGAAFGRAIFAALPAGPVLTSGEFEQVVAAVRPPRAMNSRMAWLSTVVIRC